ncbi:MAG: redox-regulated ATPase YchF [Verrucomicrobiales bacterium]|nr:redox-regulated ATPase YchF [Verrucomicrobiales bacterium]|tara:strand:- start:4455 stop:5558 length:1104 start_codon:yes stop_codon:yes gene_type:complete
MLKAGIVGLPNVGKSTLFNALTRTRKAESANYPFCTIEPNIGVVVVPDERLEPLAKIANTTTIIPAAIEFADIAGLVKGAADGEGLGNKFLSHIRETDAIVQVVRCFEDGDITHVDNNIDPIRDIETIFTELVLADLESANKRREKISRDVKRGDKEAAVIDALLEKLIPHLNEGKPALTADLSDEERATEKELHLLTSKRTIFAANVKDEELADADNNPHVQKVRDYAKDHVGCETVVISAQIESELIDLEEAEAKEFLSDLGVDESGVGKLIRGVYDLLGLRTYFTAGEKEVRAWTIRTGDTAPKAAGAIHTDFEHKFIKAETVAYDDLSAAGSVAAARDAGKYRMEGKDYLVKDGDVLLFRHGA